MKAPARTAEQMLEAARLGGTIEVVETCRNGDQLVRCTVPGEPGATTVKIPRHLAAAPSPDPVDVLAVMDRQLRNRAERANRYSRKADKAAQKNGEPQITADRMAAYENLMLYELREARAAVAELIKAMRLAQRMNREALGKFNWGASALDANAIDLLNRAPAAVEAALARVQVGAA